MIFQMPSTYAALLLRYYSNQYSPRDSVISYTYLKIVGMLPHINTKNRHISTSNWVLILRRRNIKTTLRPASTDEPAPATALDSQKLSAERLHKGILRAPAGDDSILQRRRCAGEAVTGCARRSQVLPEEGVVDVAATVELDLLLQGDQGWDVVGLGGRGVCGEGGVQVVDVGLVVLLVVDFHDLL